MYKLNPMNAQVIVRDRMTMDPQNSHAEIISTLPTENGWLSDDNYPLYLFNGFWYSFMFIGEAIAAQAGSLSFDPSPSDVIVASNPKSGTTWLKALTFAIRTRERLYPNNQHPLQLENPHDLIPRMSFMDTDQSAHDNLNLVCTHLPYTGLPASVAERGCKIVYIWRNPKDAFISLWHMCQKMRPNKKETEPISLQDAFDLFCNGVSWCGPYWDHVLGYWKARLDYPESVLFLKYEDMMEDTEGHVKRLAQFMGCPFSAQEEEGGVVANVVEICSFEKLSNMEINKGDLVPSNGAVIVSKSIFFRKGKVGDWRSYLTHEMGAKIDRITMEKLGPLLN